MKITMSGSELARAAKLQTEIAEVQRSIATMDEMAPHKKLAGQISVTTEVGTSSLGITGAQAAQAFELLYGMRQDQLERLKLQLDQLGITLED